MQKTSQTVVERVATPLAGLVGRVGRIVGSILRPVRSIAGSERDADGAERRSMQRYHIEILVLSSIAVLGAVLLEVRSDQRVGLRFASWLTAPETCVSRDRFGVPCPGCGLTRSFIQLARGDLAGSWQQNRVGWILALATLFQFPYRWYALRRDGVPFFPSAVSKWIGVGLISLLILNWLYNLASDACQ